MPENHILEKMLDRLYASLIRGPSLNCRPHSSRQRVDLAALTDMGCADPSAALVSLLSDERQSRVPASVPPPAALQSESQNFHFTQDAPQPVELSESDKRELQAWRDQKSLLTKLRNLSEDARTYEQDTGVAALNIGYPLLSMPPNQISGSSRRTLAPIAFIPVALEVNAGRNPGLQLTSHGQGVDLITPNPALMAWLERETGKPPEDLFEDEQGDQPWREIHALITHVIQSLELANVDPAALTNPDQLRLQPTPRAEDLPHTPAVLPAAVLGLFPASNQGLLRDTRAMIDAPAVPESVAAFVDVDATLEPAEHALPDDTQPLVDSARRIDDERFVTLADPFQARAVQRARTSRGVVIHGPPGTGKSQTITNIIADHLARGQRVLFVCDKRTALDVVSNRLDHLDLGRLCALVHDPQRDQRDLYMKIRAALDDLPDLKTKSTAAKRLEQTDAELTDLHQQLSDCCQRLMDPVDDQPSFHTLMGRWLDIDAPPIESLDEQALKQSTLDQFEQSRDDMIVIFERAASVDWPNNPWRDCAGSSLDAFLARPVDVIRQGLASCVEDARVADAAAHDHIPPFKPDQPLGDQVSHRTALADRIAQFGRADPAILQHVAELDADAAARLLKISRDARPHRPALDGPLDTELALVIEAQPPTLRQLNGHLDTITRYMAISNSWKRFFAIGLNRAARRLLAAFGQTTAPADTQRLQTFLTAQRARLLLTHAAKQLLPHAPTGPVIDDPTLTATLDSYHIALAALDTAQSLAPQTRAALTDTTARAQFINGLQLSAPRAAALESLEQSMRSLDLFGEHWLPAATAQLREGKQAGQTLTRLQDHFDSLESVIRARDAVAQLPAALAAAVTAALTMDLDPDAALAAVLKAVLAVELTRRLAADPDLQRIDDQRLAHQFNRYRQLEDQKRTLVRDAILHHWITKQQQRLLAATGSRLNADGAELRRRLFVRGKRAMRLRQMIAVGAPAESSDDGDPLFDMCPVWMASPETVAQVFPRLPLFDTVIFDEASQCRLEEALPVLTRAHRFVIAGDPKQLPPTRFFEAAITTSEDHEPESQQDLFEAQQTEVEDLLAAALNLQVEEAYLDVHYRSRNADLIEFSNQHFYKNRLQAIPGHPSARTQDPPLTLTRADGIYENRSNRIEAQRVVQIVHELLRRADPPSIGIACFNLPQRDLIVDLLDDAAVDDPDFAQRLATARRRRGEGSFEGLFVKNLENVQGDERDHIIISTTYGPTPEGNFYRRFGPLARAGGGRRLNVLVTRARQEIHLITSIPREAYLATQQLPPRHDSQRRLPPLRLPPLR